MKPWLGAGMLLMNVALLANPVSAQLNGEPIGGDKCHGIAVVSERIVVDWPIQNGNYGRANDGKGNTGYFALLDYSLLDSYWRYAMSGQTAGDCVGSLTQQVCAELPPEAQEVLVSAQACPRPSNGP